MNAMTYLCFWRVVTMSAEFTSEKRSVSASHDGSVDDYDSPEDRRLLRKVDLRYVINFTSIL